MSDIFSVPPVPAKTGNKFAGTQWVDASAVLHRMLHRLNGGERREMVLRCDELPLLQGTEKELELIFSALLQMVLHRKETVSQLFLHIHSKTALQETVSMTGSTYYLIQFNTNITPCADWIQNNRKQLTEIETILEKYNGSLHLAEAQGCIFSFSLPGKTQ